LPWLLGVAFLAACSFGPLAPAVTPGPDASSAASENLATFHESGLVFAYPASWRIFHHQAVSSLSSSIADLATVDVPAPCVTTQDAVGTETACRDRFHLSPDTLVVHVSTFGMPGFDILKVPAGARPMLVDGLPAYTVSGRPEDPAGGADEQISWTLASPGSVGNAYEISALLRGPDLAAVTVQLEAMIASLRHDPPVTMLPNTTEALDAAIAKALATMGAQEPAWRCFPARVGIATGTIAAFPSGPSLAAPHHATCRTAVERTALQLWRVTFTVKLDEPDPQAGGDYAAELWVSPDGTPGEMTSGSTAP
jgi:hypothetical protein